VLNTTGFVKQLQFSTPTCSGSP